MADIDTYVHEGLFAHPWLAGLTERITVALVGSRAVHYHVPSSDYDLVGLCDRETYERIAFSAGPHRSANGIDVPIDKEAVKREFGMTVDASLYEVDTVRRAIHEYNDVVLWIWTHAVGIVDQDHTLADLKGGFKGYPRAVLEQKLRYHFLRDFDLSVHGIPYHTDECPNVFAVVYALSSKIAEFCRICCLLDGKPFPYAKWLLRASTDTSLGKTLTLIFDRVLDLLTDLGRDPAAYSNSVRTATEALDMEACDVVENALIAWGLDEQWVRNAYHYLEDVLF
jgi:hypothetical protein